MMSTKSMIFAVAALSALPFTAARAGDWVVTVGARVSALPPYEGADHDVFRPSPTFNLRPADRPYRFTPPDGGTTFALIYTDHFVLGPMARFQYQRDATGDLQGLQKVNWAVEPGAFAEVWPVNWLRGRVEARHGVTGHHGFVGDAGLDLVYTGRRWDASLGGRVGWGDNNYMDTYFAVTPQDAARSPLFNQVYNPSGGRRYAGVEAALAYNITDRWKVTGDVGYHRLSPQIADSPIIQLTGNPNQYFAGVGVSYAFNLHL